MAKLNGEDIYKSTFKLYKNWTPTTQIPLINFNNQDYDHHFEPVNLIFKNESCLIDNEFGHDFTPFDQWKIFKSINCVNGLYVVKGILKNCCRHSWFSYFKDQLPLKYEQLNLKSNIELSNKNLQDLETKLRWITFGYHHDWNTKHYNLEQKEIHVPKRILVLCELINIVLLNLNDEHISQHFKPEAGIVNYYTKNSTLYFHVDNSELNHKVPLFSLSLGQSAIFLIGEKEKNNKSKIVPLLLEDSDLLIMSGESRLAYHAIPKIIENASPSDKQPNNKILRINVNIRQVF